MVSRLLRKGIQRLGAVKSEAELKYFEEEMLGAPWRDLVAFDSKQAFDSLKLITQSDQSIGGQSTASIDYKQYGNFGSAHFHGEVKFEGIRRPKLGGYANFQSTSQKHKFVVTGFEALELRVKGDGRSYALNLHASLVSRMLIHQAKIKPPAGGWTTVVVPFDDLVFLDRGKPLQHADIPLDDDFVNFGFTTMDGNDGPFSLELSYIRALPTYDPLKHATGALSSRQQLPSAAVAFFRSKEKKSESSQQRGADQKPARPSDDPTRGPPKLAQEDRPRPEQAPRQAGSTASRAGDTAAPIEQHSKHGHRGKGGMQGREARDEQPLAEDAARRGAGKDRQGTRRGNDVGVRRRRKLRRGVVSPPQDSKPLDDPGQDGRQ